MKKGARQKINYHGQYNIIATLGKGSYGNVYEAKPTRGTQTTVAIKHIPDIFSSRTMAKRTLREIHILHLARDHPNIVKLIDIIAHTRSLYSRDFTAVSLVLECMECDLKDILASDQFFTKGHIQYILYQIFAALNHMHQLHIAHRDLKPANILINADCDIRICDFGLSKIFDPRRDELPASEENSIKSVANMDKKRSKSRDSGKLTNHVVTRWYRAPEIILLSQTAKYLPKIDIWALGCIACELLEMLPENCPNANDRAPMFPGSSCYPLSPAKKNRKKREDDQLNIILDVIGTPSQEESSHIVRPDAVAYLSMFVPHRSAIDWNQRFPGSENCEIELVKSMLKFDVKRRLSAAQGMRHKFVQKFRSRKRETWPNPISHVPNDAGMEMVDYKQEMSKLVKSIKNELQIQMKAKKK